LTNRIWIFFSSSGDDDDDGEKDDAVIATAANSFSFRTAYNSKISHVGGIRNQPPTIGSAVPWPKNGMGRENRPILVAALLWWWTNKGGPSIFS
jgi:hypothetical protein